MPTKAICCGEESVQVSVYVERPRKRVSSTPNRRYHKYHHHHYQHKVGRGYNRRADLLLYSQQLREVARSQSAAPTPALQSPYAASNHPQHTTKIINVRTKRKYLGSPTCLGDWKKVLIPSFLKSWVGHQNKERRKKKKKTKQHIESATHKMNVIIKSLDVQKKWGFITKLFSTLKKGR